MANEKLREVAERLSDLAEQWVEIFGDLDAELDELELIDGVPENLCKLAEQLRPDHARPGILEELAMDLQDIAEED